MFIKITQNEKKLYSLCDFYLNIIQFILFFRQLILEVSVNIFSKFDIFHNIFLVCVLV